MVLFDNLYGLDDQGRDITDEKLYNIIAGLKYQNLEIIEKETLTNIYVYPSLQHSTNTPQYTNRIWITGETDNIKRAWKMFLDYCQFLSMREELQFHPRKIKWMVNKKADKLQEIMGNNDSYIWVPQSETSSNSVYVYGDDKNKIKCTTHAIFRLARDFITASFEVKPTRFSKTFASTQEIHNLITFISGLTGAEVLFEGNTFEIFGLSSEVSEAVSLLFINDIIKTFDHYVCFTIDLLPDYQVFVRGKEDGKLKAIQRSADVDFSIENGNQQIRVYGTNPEVVKGLCLFQDELPAEISFYIPEEYHRPYIIGYDGKIIRRIIGDHTAFVQCSEGVKSVDCDNVNHNIVARTPTKYASNLVRLKRVVLDLVGRALPENETGARLERRNV